MKKQKEVILSDFFLSFFEVYGGMELLSLNWTMDLKMKL